MQRRTFFGVALALLASVPALAQSLRKPVEPAAKPEPDYIRYLYVEATTFDGWDSKQHFFKISCHRFPQGDATSYTWKYTIPPAILLKADFIQVVGGPVLKDRNGKMRPRDPIEMHYAPLRDHDWLIENGFRVARNESYTSI